MPLTESELFQLNRLLDKRRQSLPEAQAQRDRERDRERKLREKSDRLAAEEARLARRLAQLHVDIDTISGQLYQIAPHATAFRHVNERLQQLGTLVPKQSFFNTRFDTLDQNQIQLFAEIGLSLFEASTRRTGKPSLREKMKDVRVDIGPDGPGAGGPSDGRAELAARIVQAGRRRRGEE